MGMQEIIVLGFLALAVVYVGYRIAKTYSGKKGGGECDKCGIDAVSADKKKRS